MVSQPCQSVTPVGELKLVIVESEMRMPKLGERPNERPDSLIARTVL